MQAVVLAAGLGTRLRPVTQTRSKAMVPVLGRPLVERAILPLVENGICDFVFVVAPDDQKITSHFTQGTGLDISARFVVQEQQLGTAHALGAAAHLIEGPFAVWACDSLVDSAHVGAVLEAFDESDAVLSLLDVAPELVSRSAAVELEGAVVRQIVEKPRLEKAPSFTVSLPHYVFKPQVLDFLSELQPSSRGEYELPDAIQNLIDGAGRVLGVRTSTRTQVSSPEDLLALNRMLLRDQAESEIVEPKHLGRDVDLIEPLRVDDGVIIPDGCEIGPEVYLESGCRIGRGAVIRRSIVLQGGCVGDCERVEDAIVT